MKMYWKSVMLADLLFLPMERSGCRIVIGMIQPNGTRYQGFAIYGEMKDPETKALGFFDTADAAKRAVEFEARIAYREISGADDVAEETCVVRDYEKDAVPA